MKKLIISGIIFLLIFIGHGPAFAQDTEAPDSNDNQQVEEVHSYDLFWPIVAGKTRGDFVYSLKQLKEKVTELLSFSNFAKADYNIKLSEKRFVEAEKLLNDGDYENAIKSFKDQAKRHEKALGKIENIRSSGENANDLVGRLTSSIDKKIKLLEYRKTTISADDELKIIEDELNNLLQFKEKL